MVVQALGREIVSGHFREGEILPGDNELAERFRVSRTVLREAMKTLAAKGLVVPRARVGTRVTARGQWSLFDPDILGWTLDGGLDPTLLSHLADMRLAFEPQAASLAAQVASPDDIERLYGAIEDLSRPDHSAESLARADLVLHLAVLDASGNPFMHALGGLIETALAGMFRISSTGAVKEGQVAEVAEEHRAIVDAIARKDAEGARRAMQAVILHGREDYRSQAQGLVRQA